MYKVTVQPAGKVIEAQADANLREVLMQNGFQVKSTCGGCASCGACVVKLISGDVGVSPVEFEEKQLLGNVFHITNERLSCQTRIQGNITVDISMHMQAAPKPKTIVRKPKTEEETENEGKQEVTPKKIKEGGFRKPKAFKYDATEE